MFFLAMFCGTALAHTGALSKDIERLEENGEYDAVNTSKQITPSTPLKPPLLCLFIPESTNDKVCMFSPLDGSYCGDFIIDDTSSTPQYDLETPINIIQGPDNHFYLSDQISDAVYVFDADYGQYLFTYADSSDGLNDIRGIDFRLRWTGMLHILDSLSLTIFNSLFEI